MWNEDGERIAKDPARLRVRPNFVDYDAARRDFSWENARSELQGLPGGRGINIAHEAVDRHAEGPLANRVAFRFLRLSGATEERTYAELRRETNRFANALRRLGGLQPGQLPQSMQAFGIAGGGGLMALFASHPPIEERIAALTKLGGTA